MKRSIMSRPVNAYLRATRMTVKSAIRDLDDKKDKTIYNIPKGVKLPYKAEKKMYGSMEVFEAHGTNEGTLMYFHGGAYCHQITKFHWQFLADISKMTNCGFSVPNYPMTPQFSYKESYLVNTQVKHPLNPIK